MIPSFWFRWLQFLTLGLIVFGTIMFLMPDLTLDIFSLIFYTKIGGFQTLYPPEANVYHKFIHGDLGATIIGWGVTVYLVLSGPFRRVEPGAWAMIALPLAAWFVTDAGYSVYTGYWRNAVFNLVLFLLFSIPLVATRKYFKGKN